MDYKWTPEADELLANAVTLVGNDKNNVTPEHLLKAFIGDRNGRYKTFLQTLGIDQDFLSSKLSKHLIKNTAPKDDNSPLLNHASPLNKKIQTWVYEQKHLENTPSTLNIDVYDIFVWLFATDSFASLCLKEAGLTRKKLFDAIEQTTGRHDEYSLDNEAHAQWESYYTDSNRKNQQHPANAPKMSDDAQVLVQKATALARGQGYKNVMFEHLLAAFLEVKDKQEFLQKLAADLASLSQSVTKQLADSGKAPAAAVSNPSRLKNDIGLWGEAHLAPKQAITAYDLFAMLLTSDCLAKVYMEEAGITLTKTFAAIEGVTGTPVAYRNLNPSISELFDLPYDAEADGSKTDSDSQQDFNDDDDEQDKNSGSSEEQIERQQKKLMRDPLKSFTVNMTQEAKDGKLMPMYGHDKEIAEMIQTLCRKSKCNPLLVGDEGVGKTAAVEGLAFRIATGDVPDILKDHEIYSLDLTSLLAGCVWHGMMEERVQGVINAVSEDPKAILFIDEIHTIVGAGVNDKDALGVSNMLKPVLARGGIKCIGSTTYQEFTRRFEKEKALARRFYKIDVMEPSRADSIKILEEIVPQYKEFHHIDCDDSAVQAAVDLSIRYIPDRKLPDKAIDLLDEAFAMAKINGENAITAESVKKVVSRIAKISLENMDDDEESGLKNLAAKIGAQIFGQEQAIQDVVRAVKKARSGFKNPEKPEASFLFVGSTGVGKTELCKVLAKELNRPFLRYDMSEYPDEHSCQKLIGCERGYHLSEEGGILTNAIHRNPHAIVLFDEIEKAHPIFYNLLLQVLDYGTLTDGYGEKADFRNCLIIMTSNVGVAVAADYKSVGFGVDDESNDENRKAIIKSEIQKTFSPEFRNRLDKIVMFNTLDKDVAKDVARREVEKIVSRLLEKKIYLFVTDAVIDLIVEKGYSKEFGGRNIAKKAEELLGDVLIDEILFGRLKNGGDVTLDVKDGKVCIGAEEDASSAE